MENLSLIQFIEDLVNIKTDNGTITKNRNPDPRRNKYKMSVKMIPS